MVKLWALAKRYVFDVCIVLGSAGAVLEMILTHDDPEGPNGTLWVMCLLVALIPLPLLFRRRFPFGAPAALFAVAVGRIVRQRAARSAGRSPPSCP